MKAKTPILVLVLACTLAALVAGAPARAALRVVASHPDLAALAQAVGGDRVEVVSLCEPTQDPHFVDARPNLMLALNRADLLVVVGLELEVGWLPTLLTGARNADILPGHDGYLDTSGFVERQEVPTGPIDRSMGDLHPGGNPHFSRDPRSGLRIAAGIAKRLARLDPDGASAYRRNYAAFERRLEAKMDEWRAQLAPYRGAELVGYHASWVYFADWLGLRLDLFVEPKPGIPPDPAHVANLLKLMRARHTVAVLQEEYYPNATSRLLADKTGAELIAMPGGVHLDRGEDYVAYVDGQVTRIVAALARGAAGGDHDKRE